MKRIVVVGTGTNVGKTAVSLALLQGLAGTGRTALALKPVESGVSPDRADTTDAARLGSAAGHAPRCLFALRDALSPHLAAEREGRVIQIDEVLAWIGAQEGAARSDGWTLIETAGGLCTPLSLATSNLDLVGGLAPCDIALVAPNRLGVIHDVLACVSLLRHSARSPALILLTDALGRDPSSTTNRREITRITQLPVHEYAPELAPAEVLTWFAATGSAQSTAGARDLG